MESTGSSTAGASRSGDSWQAGLACLLREQGKTAAALYNALQKEHSALNDDGDVGPIVAEKEALLRQLETAEALRDRWLAGAGFAPAEPAAWLPPHETDEHELGALWQTLLDHVAECRRLNRVNGHLIAHRRTFIQSALSVLRGQSAQQPVYAADGRRIAGRGGRCLGTV